MNSDALFQLQDKTPITGLSIKLNNRVCVWFDLSKNLSQCRLRTDWEVCVKQITEVYYDFGKILLFEWWCDLCHLYFSSKNIQMS